MALLRSGAFARTFASALLLLASAAVPAADGTEAPAALALRAVGPAGTGAELQLRAEAWAAGLRDGELAIPLPDGRQVQIDDVGAREVDGLIHVHGTTQTANGPQSVVLTRQGEALWGVVPDAEGAVWEIVTEGGKTRLFRSGGLAPRGIPPASDVRIPPRQKRAGTAWPLSDAQAQALASSGPVQIDLLGLVSRELAPSPGAESEARARFRHLVEVSNRVFIDSGVPARLHIVGLEVVDIASLSSASQSLDAITSNDPSLGVDVHGLRDRVAADLVALIRPYASTARACGVAWGNGFELAPETADARYGYSVTHLDPCGAYVMAHEIGHNLGAHHDIATETAADGRISRGAYIDSHGRRETQAPAFHTVMAYATGPMTWLGRFSDPQASACEGRACGVDGYANNARTLSLMAPRVAAFRSPPGTLVVDVGRIDEGDAGESVATLRIRHEGPVPAQGLRFTVATRGASATPGVDFRPLAPVTVELLPSQPVWIAQLRVLGDTVAEGEERFVVALEGFSDAGRPSIEHPVAIPDDDPKRRVAVRLGFQGAPAPPESVQVDLVVADAAGSRRVSLPTAPPEHRLTLDVADGARVLIERMVLPAPFAEVRHDFGVVRGDIDQALTVQGRVRLRGRLSAPDGVALPTSAVVINIEGLEGPGTHVALTLQPPAFEFDVQARFGAAPEVFVVRPPAPFLHQQRIKLPALTVDRNETFPLATGAVITGRLSYADGAQPPAAPLQLWVNERFGWTQNGSVAPFDGQEFRVAVRPDAWVSVDGSIGPGLGMIRDDLMEVRRDITRDYVVRPAPRVSGTTTLRVIEPPGTSNWRVPVPVDRPLPSGGAFAGVAILGGDATAGSDLRLDGWADGEVGARHVFIPLTLLPDATAETVETLRLGLNEPLGLVLDPHEVRVEIHDEAHAVASRLPILNAVPDLRISEGSGGARQLSLPLSLSRPAPAGGVRIRVGAAFAQDGYGSYAAQPPGDFELVSSVVEFPEGTSTASILWTIHGDRLAEVEETFHLVLLPEGELLLRDPDIRIAIIDDDSFLGLVADRFTFPAASTAATLELAVLANDLLPIGIRYLGGQLTISRPPARGSASVDTRNTPSLDDDRIVYRPEPGVHGEFSLGYRVCQTFGSPCQTAEVQLVHLPAVAADAVAIRAPGTADRGRLDTTLAHAPAMRAARFEAHGLVAPTVFAPTLTQDATPEDPFDGAGSAITLRTFSAESVARTRRVFVDARSLSGGHVDLYLGRDANGNGRADRGEETCVAASAGAAQRCELPLSQAAGAGASYWVMLHSRSGAQNVRAEIFEVDIDRPATAQQLAATGPGSAPAGATVPLRIIWNDATLAPGQVRGGWLQVRSDASTSLGWLPVRVERDAGAAVTYALHAGVDHALALAGTVAHEGLYVDVPPGMAELRVTTRSAVDVDLYLAHVDAPLASGATPTIPVAPARGLASARASTASGDEVVSVPNPAPGRWYVTPVNASTATAELTVRATLRGSGPRLRPGGYFNPRRSGNGLFVYPAGSEWAALWYTYLQDGTATWYYLQAPAPGGTGVWRGTIFRSAWDGSRNHLTPVGEATLTPRAGDAFTFSYTLDGESGSEAYETFGGGCPTFAGAPLDVSGHWFDPVRSGTGYSVQLFPDYEFYLVFGYDARGVPRYLVAERSGIGAATQALTLEQNTGACPLCTRTGNPARNAIGTLTRTFGAGTLQRIQLNGTYTEGVPGTWAANDAVIPLGELQGCAAR